MSDFGISPTLPDFSKIGADAASAGSAAKATSASGLPTYLSLEGMVAWLTEQISKTDSSLQIQLKGIQARKEQAGEMLKCLEELKKLQGSSTADEESKCPIGEGSNWAKWKSDRGELEKTSWYQALPAAGKAAINTLLDQINMDDGKVMGAQVKTAIDIISDTMTATNSSNEIDMIKLQEAIGARSRLLETCSNILKKFGDTQSSMIRNMA